MNKLVAKKPLNVEPIVMLQHLKLRLEINSYAPLLQRGNFHPLIQPPWQAPVFLSHVLDTWQFSLQVCKQFLPYWPSGHSKGIKVRCRFAKFTVVKDNSLLYFEETNRGLCAPLSLEYLVGFCFCLFCCFGFFFQNDETFHFLLQVRKQFPICEFSHRTILNESRNIFYF